MCAYKFRGFVISDHMMGVLHRYIEHHCDPGCFLIAVLCNDLTEAVGNADVDNLHNLPAYVGYLYNEAPAVCWGSPEKVKAWLELDK